jgi:hypothetical protein
MPKSFKAKESLNTTKRQADDIPRADDAFVEGFTWAEFKNENLPRNPAQVKIDLEKENHIWFYLGKKSTEAKAQFTEDLAKPRHNPKGHFLDTIPKPIITAPRQSYAASYPSNLSQDALQASKVSARPSQPGNSVRPEKPYVYKPRDSVDRYRVDQQAYRSQQNFVQQAPAALPFGTDPRYRPAQQPTASTANSSSSSSPAYPTNYKAPSSNPSASRGVLAPPAPYRPSYQPPMLQPPRQNNPFNGRSRPNPFAKYSYLQKEHNRSPLEYKSPYRPGGGFMNGYQGNLEKHLQDTMLQSRSALAAPLFPHNNNQKQSSSNQQPFPSYNSSPTTPYTSYGSSGLQNYQTSLSQQTTKPAAKNTWENRDPPQPHATIRPEYRQTIYHNHYQPQLTKSQIQLKQSHHPAQYERHPQQTQQFQPFKQASPMVRPSQHSPPYQPRADYSPTNVGAPAFYPPQPTKAHNAPPRYQPPSEAYKEPTAVYAHQQYFQQPPAQTHSPRIQAQVPELPMLQAQSTKQRDFPDVPADSTSLIEKMMQNLKKVTSTPTIT